MGHFQVRYNSRVVIYDRKTFIRLATGSGPLSPKRRIKGGTINGFHCHKIRLEHVEIASEKTYLFK